MAASCAGAARGLAARGGAATTAPRRAASSPPSRCRATARAFARAGPRADAAADRRPRVVFARGAPGRAASALDNENELKRASSSASSRRRDARGVARTRPLAALSNGSMDEDVVLDPESAALAQGAQGAQAGEGDMREVAAWIGAATLFGLGLGAFAGREAAEEYFAGYLLEQSLSVDNLFVFVLVFDYFKVPMSQQQKVLGYGIGGAMAMRAAMIVAGYEAITNFKPILLVFAGILIFSSYKLIAEEEEEEEDMSQNAIVKFASSLVPVSDEYDGDNFFTLVDGVKTATPLLLCLVVIELSDVVFAVDSIPAVFGVTQDPLIVYSSNIFAILGLRSLYAFVATMVAELEVRSDEPVFVFRAPVAPRATAFARRAPFLEDFARARLSPSLSVVQ